jgi:tRNA pseudouridine55 synthase
MNRRPPLRDVHGILLLDKPLGLTSNAALQTVKRLYRARKAGHTGSLDPLASGLLPLCFGDATKVSAFLLDADKRYRVGVQLGVRTATGDAEGAVIERRPVPALDPAHLQAVLRRFTGPLLQVPPMHSAVKHQGQPLYKLAHKGIEVAREARDVVVHELRLLHCADDRLDLEIACSKGTYIRTLAEDIGEALGTGAHVVELRRTVAGPFHADRMLTLAQLEAAAAQGFEALDDLLLPMETALAHWPAVCLSEELARYVRQGQAVFVPKAPTQGWVKLHTADRRFLGVGRVLDDGRVAPKRLIGGAGT